MKNRFIVVTVLAIAGSMLFGCAKPAVNSDLEKFDSVISALRADQYYAFADICKDHDILLVTDAVFDNGKGEMESIGAMLYDLDKDGKAFELGEVSSESTAYPLSVYDGCLMFGSHHHMAEIFVEDGNMMTRKDASEVFDQNGAAKYYTFDLEAKFEGEVEDDSDFTGMLEDYGKATVIRFIQAK